MTVPAKLMLCLVSSCAMPGTDGSAFAGRLLARTSIILYVVGPLVPPAAAMVFVTRSMVVAIIVVAIVSTSVAIVCTG